MIGREHGRGWSGWFASLITSNFLRDCFLQYTKFLTLSDKESAIVSALIPVHASEKQGEIKVVPILIRLLARSTHYSALIGRLAEIGALLMKKVVMTK